ncbi:MAG: pyrroline-5-carboxylate reductase [Cyanobacteria bacterium Co-bin13]|nr:pyrroline-5-carboxylate reductase [Cyanobacteria bacterium Co-bin13]
MLGVIGGGVMGEALISRLLDQGVFSPETIVVSDPQPDRRAYLTDTYGIATTADNAEAVAKSSVLLLAIKPQIIDKVAPGLVQAAAESPRLLLSILAGVTLTRLQSHFAQWPLVRAMPNTPATVGAGITAIAAGTHTGAADLDLARRIFQSVGDVVEVPESLMDAVTGLSGSGPGYVAIVIEALADGGVAAGLPRTTAMQLALQTVRGTAELLLQSDLHPAQLKDRVTSPGGTTITGIARLEAAGLRSALIEAVRSACDRSRELGG